MAKSTLTVPAYVDRLAAALREQLRGARVDYEQVRRDRYRFVVVWDKFASLGHPERQRRVWDIAEATLPKGDLPNVAMIITLGPKEIPE